MADFVDQVFDRVRPEPDPAFVEALHRRALASLEALTDGAATAMGGRAATQPPVLDPFVEPAGVGDPVEVVDSPRTRRRRRAAWAVIAVAAAAALLALVLRQPASHAPVVPATSIPTPTSTVVTTTSTAVTTTAPGSAPVPKVKGLTRDAAQAAIEAAGFKYVGSGENLAPCPQAGVLTAWDSQPSVDVVLAPGATVTVRYYCPLSHFVDATG